MKFLSDRTAVSAVEYGIVAGVLGLVLLLVFQDFGLTLSTLFLQISSSL